MEVLAVEGSYASVIGGAPAAGVVFTGEVDARTAADPRVTALERRVADASRVERARLLAELAEVSGRRAVGEAGRGGGGVRRRALASSAR